MKKFTKKGLLQKIIIAILIVFCVNFTVPTYSSAGTFGGVVGNAILDLAASLGDIVESLMQYFMTGQYASGTSLADSDVMAYYDDTRVQTGGENPTISVTSDELDLGHLASRKALRIPIIEYTPEEIFSNKVPYLDINFINPTWTSESSDYGVNGSAAILQQTISSWYIALRNLSIVGLLCVLVYVGIRILLTSTASDKAKYKQMFTDWLVALCILFFLHYIMSFTLVMVDSVNSAIVGNNSTAESVVISVDGTNYTTNLMGAARFMVQTSNTLQRFSYCIIYIALVGYTAVFTWHYLKRVLMMAFLTIIAPLVALTYPIDKMGDGKAQAFNMWLKEYVYNALIQPFHLIIYMVFVGSAMDLAKSNFIYALAAIAFILPAEKILRKMFGFDKAPLGTMGALTGFTLGSLSSKFGKSSSGGAKSGNSGNTNNGDSANTRTKGSGSHGIDGIDYAQNHQTNSQSGDNSSSSENGANGNNEDNSNNVNSTASDSQQVNLSQQQIQELGDDSQESSDNSQGEDSNSSRGTFRTGINNVVSAHGGAKRISLNAAKTLGNGAKFAVRTGMTLAGATTGAALGLASGKGLAGVAAGATAGKNLGSKAGRSLSNMPENIYGAANKAGGKVANTVRKEIDTFNGNTNLQDAAAVRRFMNSESTEQSIRDKWTESHNGVAPTDSQVRQQLEDIRPYVEEGMTDIDAINKARKAEQFGVSSSQSAKIALLAKQRGITRAELDDDKKYAANQRKLTYEYKQKGFSDKEASKQADYILNVMKAQEETDHNLNNIISNNKNTQSNTKANDSSKQSNTSKKTNDANTQNNTKANSSSKK